MATRTQRCNQGNNVQQNGPSPPPPQPAWRLLHANNIPIGVTIVSNGKPYSWGPDDVENSSMIEHVCNNVIVSGTFERVMFVDRNGSGHCIIGVTENYFARLWNKIMTMINNAFILKGVAIQWIVASHLSVPFVQDTIVGYLPMSADSTLYDSLVSETRHGARYTSVDTIMFANIFDGAVMQEGMKPIIEHKNRTNRVLVLKK